MILKTKHIRPEIISEYENGAFVVHKYIYIYLYLNVTGNGV